MFRKLKIYWELAVTESARSEIHRHRRSCDLSVSKRIASISRTEKVT